MDTYEYSEGYINDFQLIEVLNIHGAMGWELVAIWDAGNGKKRCVYKRKQIKIISSSPVLSDSLPCVHEWHKYADAVEICLRCDECREVKGNV